MSEETSKKFLYPKAGAGQDNSGNWRWSEPVGQTAVSVDYSLGKA